MNPAIKSPFLIPKSILWVIIVVLLLYMTQAWRDGKDLTLYWELLDSLLTAQMIIGIGVYFLKDS